MTSPPILRRAPLALQTVGLLGLVASVVAGLLWDHVSHAAVFFYGAVFAVIGSVALLILLPAEQVRRTS